MSSLSSMTVNRKVGRIAPSVQSSNRSNLKQDGSSIDDRLEWLRSLDPIALREEWRKLKGSDPPRLSRDLMVRSVAYALQVEAFGGLSRSTLRKLEASHEGASQAPQSTEQQKSTLSAGTRLVREWHGRTYGVEVAEEGFLFEGKTYRSLTEIARRITGSHWSGPRFFGLAKRGR
jgi:hypothetical protein